jgi:hypothetical protein
MTAAADPWQTCAGNPRRTRAGNPQRALRGRNLPATWATAVSSVHTER